MPFTLTMPKLSPTMDQGVIAKWHKKEGEKMDVGDLILEIATDKATVEHSAIDEGFLRKILVKEGESAPVNGPIAVLSETADESIEGYKPEGEVAVAEEVGEAPVATAVAARPKVSATIPSSVVASPLARKMAQAQGLDLTTVQGTGPGGRIVSRDLQFAKPTLPLAGAPLPLPPEGTYSEEPLSQFRQIIAERLQQSKTTIPHFYVQNTVNAAALIKFREKLKGEGLKVTFNDLIVRACALTLREHPDVNSGFNGNNNTLIRHNSIDICVAVNIDEGLITPIIPQTDQKDLTTISQEAKALAEKARAGKLQPHEFQGGSFTVSNMGMLGATQFQAIINPPQAAILAVGAIREEPVVEGGKVVAGHTLHLTLSCDHRVVDGAEGALFLKDLKGVLEGPEVLS